MESGGLLFEGLGVVMHEAALFAVCGFLFMGFSDVVVDLIWIARTVWRRLTVYSRFERARADTLEKARSPGRLAVFIPAWEESGVIGPMLRHTLAVAGQKFRPKIGGATPPSQCPCTANSHEPDWFFQRA